MSLSIEDANIVAAIRELADKAGRSPENVVREAVAAAAQRQREIDVKLAKLKVLQDRVAFWPDSGL